MPNYGLVVTPTYNPMSYEQYIKPFQDYAQVYNATVDQIDALEMEANQWEKLADSDIDAPQYRQYKNYADDLRKYANEIATQGLSSKTRAGLSRMRQRYFAEIKPIEEAYNYRQKLAEEQRKLNPTGDLQYTVDFTNVGLGEIMRNPNMGYSARSLSEMEKEGFEQARALSSRLVSAPERAMAGQYFRLRQGVSAEYADAWLQYIKSQDPESASRVVELIDNIYGKVRNSYNTDSDINGYSTIQNIDADKRIASGILKGLTYNEEYQVNRESDYGHRNGGGESNSSDLIPIGHEATINGKTYTVINESGNYKYYNVDDGKEAKLSDADIKWLNENQVNINTRYAIRRFGSQAQIIDLKTNMPVQRNGHYITFNPSTHTWNSRTHTLEVIPKTMKLGKDNSYVIHFKYKGVGDMSKHTGGTGLRNKEDMPSINLNNSLSFLGRDVKNYMNMSDEELQKVLNVNNIDDINNIRATLELIKNESPSLFENLENFTITSGPSYNGDDNYIIISELEPSNMNELNFIQDNSTDVNVDTYVPE